MMKYLISVLIWIIFMRTTVKAECVIAESVKNAERNAQQVLLQRLDPILGQRSKQLKARNGNVYDFVVCEDVDEQHKSVSIIQNSTIILGYNNETLMSGGDNWLMMTFLKGDAYNTSCNKTHREAHILFICDSNQEEVELHTVGELKNDTCYLQFIVSHSIICPAAIQEQEGLSGGTIFMILLLVSFGAYFIFGFFYLRLVKGAKGIEQIPNREFWFRIGNILADGCGAICRCDQYCGSGSTANSYPGYSPIADRMARDLQDTDRDSALLQP